MYEGVQEEETNRLLAHDEQSMEMNDGSPASANPKSIPNARTTYVDGRAHAEMSGTMPFTSQEDGRGITTASEPEYKVYKIRWFGLVQLILLNIVVSWDVCELSCRVVYQMIS